MKIMNRFKNILLLAFAFASSLCSAQDSYILSKDYMVKILGTSNLHNWNETVENTSGNGVITWNSDGSFNLDAIKIIMDVHSIKSESSVMTNKTRSALKADENPKITFALTAPVKSIKAGATIPAKGDLTIAGVTRLIDMQVNISSPEKGKLLIQGIQEIKMSDYGVVAPTALFGALKTGDGITLDFKTMFVLSNPIKNQI